MQREKQIKSGKLLEVDFFPVYGSGRRMPERSARENKTSEQQALYNAKQATKKLVRLVNANFEKGDHFAALTYAPEKAPQSEEACLRDIRNYNRRINYKRNKLGLAPAKYIYIIEQQVYKTGKYAGLVNWHIHMFMDSALDRDTVEDMWKFGRVNCERYKPDVFGPETAAKYCAKDPKGKKRFVCSKNLKKPVEKSKDGKVGRKTVERMAALRIDDRGYWEKRYKGYEFIKCESTFNEYNSNWYVSVVMYQRENKNSVKR